LALRSRAALAALAWLPIAWVAVGTWLLGWDLRVDALASVVFALVVLGLALDLPRRQRIDGLALATVLLSLLVFSARRRWTWGRLSGFLGDRRLRALDGRAPRRPRATRGALARPLRATCLAAHVFGPRAIPAKIDALAGLGLAAFRKWWRAFLLDFLAPGTKISRNISPA
jgi:hypothetical protein